MAGMDQDRSHRRAVWLIVGLLALAACFAAWRWVESYRRYVCINDLEAKGAIFRVDVGSERWSAAWPFCNIEAPTSVTLYDGWFDVHDVRRLRRTFPGLTICHVPPDTIPPE
jgi:hypothetical protein